MPFFRLFVASLIIVPQSVWANPSVGQVVAGAANISSSGSTLTVQQLSNLAILNWHDFSISNGETTQFIQPSALSAALNRVTGGNPSAIYGTLTANGQIYLINPNGITVGPTGVINTQSFIASTLDVADASFLSGGALTFSGSSLAGISNQGQIATTGGDILLIANSVQNSGQLSAPGGTVGLVAGSQVLYAPGGTESIFVQAGSGGAEIGVDQQGQIAAATAELKAAGGNVYGLAVNNAGAVSATGVSNQGGHVFLTAEGGSISNSGPLTAAQGDVGGSVQITGDQISLQTGSSIVAGGQASLISGPGGITVNGNIAAPSVALRSGASETGGISFGPGVTVSADNQSYQAGIGDGSQSSANADLVTNAPSFVNFNGGGAPQSFIYRQDATIKDGNIPLAAQFPSGIPVSYTLQSDGGDLTVATGGNVAGSALTLSALGSVNISDNLGLASLNASASKVNVSADVTTSGGQSYNGPVTVDNSVTLTGGAVAFSGTLDDNSGGDSLTINSGAGGVSFGDAVGGNQSFGVLSVNSNGGSIAFNGTENGSLFIGGPTTLAASGPGAVSFAGGVDDANGGDNLGITAGTGGVSFAGPVGGQEALGALSVVSAGPISINGGSVQTSGGGQTYNGPVVLGDGENFLMDDGSGNISFAATVDGANKGLSTLHAQTGGSISFGGAVGSATPLDMLLASAGGAINVGPSVTMAFTGDWNDDENDAPQSANSVLLGANNITFNNPIDGLSSNLLLYGANSVTFNGMVGGGETPLASLTTWGTTNINGGSVQTSGGGQTYNGPVVLGDGWTSLRDGGAGNVAFASTVDGADAGAATLNVQTGGSVSFGGSVGGNAALNSLFAAAGGAITLNPGVTIAATGDVNDGDGPLPSANAILVGANNITINNPVDQASDLMFYVGNSVTLNNTLGANVPLNSLTTWGTTNINGGQVTTSGSQNYNGPVRVGVNDAALTSSNGSITFASTVDSPWNLDPGLTTASAGDTAFNGAVGANSPISFLTANITGDGAIKINGGRVATGGDQDYNHGVVIGGEEGAYLSGRSITFNGALDSADGSQGLTTAAGRTTFNAPVGGTPLAFLNTSGRGFMTFINGGQVTTNGDQTYGQVSIGDTNASLTSINGGVAFNGNLDSSDGGEGLTVAAKQNISFGSAVGRTSPLAYLTTRGDGTTVINGGYVSTTGDQTYGQAVGLGKNRTWLISTGQGESDKGGNITFDRALDSASDRRRKGGSQFASLNIMNGSGSVIFNGAVGAKPLGNLQINGSGETDINGGLLTTEGSQYYNGPVRIGVNDASLLARRGSISFNGAVDSAQNVDPGLTTRSAFDTTFNGAVGANSPLSFLQVSVGDEGGINVNGGQVVTAGAQAYNGPVRIGVSDAALTASNGSISFNGAVDSAQNLDPGLTIRSAFDTTFNGAVGANSPLSFLQVSVGPEAGINVNGGQVVTAGAQAYNGPVRIGVSDAALTASNGSISFNGAVDSAQNLDPGLTTNSAGDTTFNGAVGSQNTLSFLSVNVTGEDGGINLNGNVATAGAQSYAGPVRLGADAALTSGGSGISFLGPVDGGWALALDAGAGDVHFGGAVGQTSPLASLTVRGAGVAHIDGGLVATGGAQSYGADIALGGDAKLVTGDADVSLAKSVAGGDHSLTVKAGKGDIALNGPVSAGDIDLDGKEIAWSGPLSGKDLQIFGKNITMNGDVSSLGDNGVLMVADEKFLNPGANQINLTGAGRFLVYSADPADDVLGGLTGVFQFSTTFWDGPVPAFGGNGFLFKSAAPPSPLLVDSSGLVQNVVASNNVGNSNQNQGAGQGAGVSEGEAGSNQSSGGSSSNNQSPSEGNSDSSDLKDAVGSPSNSSSSSPSDDTSSKDDTQHKP